MRSNIDPALVDLVGSEARLLSLAVLANADAPMTGYRVAAVADLPRQKVYPLLRRALDSGIVRRTEAGYVLIDGDIRDLLRRRVRIEWSEDRRLTESSRVEVARASAKEDFDWFDPRSYVPNPEVATRYAKEFRRPPEKGPSRKTR